MQHRKNLIFIGIPILFWIFYTAANSAVKEAKVERDEKGNAKVNEHVTVEAPASMKFYQVGSNVLRAEEVSPYVARTISELEKKLNERIDKLEKRMTDFEAKLPPPSTKKAESK